MDIKILVATHKKFYMPDESMYIPIHVGRFNQNFDLGYIGDDTGDNISHKNSTWCELTALYWGWKNLECEYLGLVQYRRHFRLRNKGNSYNSVINKNEVEMLLRDVDILLPKARFYFMDTLEKHFNEYDFSIPEDLNNIRRIIHEITPEYDKAFETVMRRHHGHMCNMFIMRKDMLDKFCEWEFTILNEFEKCIGINRKRMIGYVAEHMLDIWIEKNQYPYIECPVNLFDKKNDVYRKCDYIFRKIGLKKRFIKL